MRVQFKSGGIHHPRLNIHRKPIANKYREGKMKRTLKREFKEFEIVEMELIQPKVAGVMSRGHWRRRGAGSGKCAHGGIGINWGWATRARGAKINPGRVVRERSRRQINPVGRAIIQSASPDYTKITFKRS